MTTAAFKFNAGIPVVLLPSGEEFPILYGNVASMADFGGSTNASAATNTTALLRAVSRVNDDGGGIVRVPGGRFDVDVPALRFLNHANVTIMGESKYSSTLVDPQDMSNAALASVPLGPNGFFTFADCTKCNVIGLGMSGANVFSQTRLSTGISVLNRKGVYLEFVSTGCIDCGVQDCYLENIEGEAVFADGYCNGLTVNDNHFYRCQTNVINWSIGDGLRAYRNRIQDPGQSPFQVGGNNYAIGNNISTMSVNPDTGLTYVTAAALCVMYRTTGALVHDNLFAGFRFSSTISPIAIGDSNVAQTVEDLRFVGNVMDRLTIGTGAADHNGVISIDAAAGVIRNVYVGDNSIMGCGGSTSGGAYRTAIRLSGGLTMSGCIGPNYISNTLGGSLDVGVHFMSTVSAGNLMRLETQRIPAGGVLVAPYVMDVASGDDARILLGTKTWDPGNVLDGAMTSTTLSMSGCRTGDGGTVSFTGTGLVAGLVFGAICTTTDIMTVTMFNKSGGPVDLNSGTLTVHVQRT